MTDIITKLEVKDPSVSDEYVIDNGRLYRPTDGRWRLFLPEDLRYDVVSMTHRELSHLRIDYILVSSLSY